MPLKNLRAIKQAGSELLSHEPQSEAWMEKIEVLATKILTRNSFCRSNLQVSQDLYEVLKQAMIQSLIIQMDDRQIVQKLCFSLSEEDWENNTEAQRYLLYWTQGVKEGIIKKVLMLQAPPDRQLLQGACLPLS
jgi:hypothetical protein